MTVWTCHYSKGVERSDPSGMSCRSWGCRPPFTGSRQRMGQCLCYQELLIQHVVPWAKRTYHDGKYIFRWIARTIQQMWQNSGFQWIIRHIRLTWTCWTSLPGAFCRRKSSQLHMLLWMPYVCPSLQNRTISQQNKSARPAPHSIVTSKLFLRKVQFILNRWTANSPAHIKSTFQELL